MRGLAAEFCPAAAAAAAGMTRRPLCRPCGAQGENAGGHKMCRTAKACGVKVARLPILAQNAAQHNSPLRGRAARTPRRRCRGHTFSRGAVRAGAAHAAASARPDGETSSRRYRGSRRARRSGLRPHRTEAAAQKKAPGLQGEKAGRARGTNEDQREMPNCRQYAANTVAPSAQTMSSAHTNIESTSYRMRALPAREAPTSTSTPSSTSSSGAKRQTYA